MALKVLMLKRKLDEKKKMLEAAQAKAEELNTREAELEADIEAAETDEEKEAVEEAVAEFETEKGANEDERTALEKEVAGLEAELAEEERKQKEAAEKREEEVPRMEREDLIKAQRDAFANAIRGMEKRTDPTDYNMAKGNNGDIIPKTIADEIITKIANISPIFEKAHKYPVKGNLSIPFYPASSAHVITAAYATEFTDLLANSGDFDSVDLTGYLAGALAKIGRTLINNTDVDVVPFVEDQMAEAFKAFIDQEAINGSENKADGMLAGITQLVTGTYKSSVTADDLIKLQCAIPDAYQANAVWLMAPATRTQIRTLKDQEGRYLLNNDVTGEYAGTLLGKPVFVVDAMPAMGTQNNKAVVYGDLSGLALKFSEELEIQVLEEKFATQHAVGVVGWTEFDAAVENAQKLAAIKMGGSDPE